LVRAHH